MTDEENIDSLFKVMTVDGDEKKSPVQTGKETMSGAAFQSTEDSDSDAIQPIEPKDPAQPKGKKQ